MPKNKGKNKGKGKESGIPAKNPATANVIKELPSGNKREGDKIVSELFESFPELVEKKTSKGKLKAGEIIRLVNLLIQKVQAPLDKEKTLEFEKKLDLLLEVFFTTSILEKDRTSHETLEKALKKITDRHLVKILNIPAGHPDDFTEISLDKFLKDDTSIDYTLCRPLIKYCLEYFAGEDNKYFGLIRFAIEAIRSADTNSVKLLAKCLANRKGPDFVSDFFGKSPVGIPQSTLLISCIDIFNTKTLAHQVNFLESLRFVAGVAQQNINECETMGGHNPLQVAALIYEETSNQELRDDAVRLIVILLLNGANVATLNQNPENNRQYKKVSQAVLRDILRIKGVIDANNITSEEEFYKYKPALESKINSKKTDELLLMRDKAEVDSACEALIKVARKIPDSSDEQLIAEIKELLQSGQVTTEELFYFKFDTQNQSALMNFLFLATEFNKDDLLQYLLEEVKFPIKRYPDLVSNQMLNIALFNAIAENKLKPLELLFNNGLDPHRIAGLKSDKKTVVKGTLLSLYAAFINAADVDITEERIQLLLLMIRSGGDIFWKNLWKEGQTTLEIAPSEIRHRMMLEFKAKVDSSYRDLLSEMVDLDNVFTRSFAEETTPAFKKIGELQKELARVKNPEEFKDAKIAQLTKDLESQKKTIEEAKLSEERVQKKLQELKRELSKKERSLEEARSQTSIAKKALEEANAKLSKNNEKMSIMDSQNLNLEAQRDKLTQKIIALEAQIAIRELANSKDLKEKLEEQRLSLEEDFAKRLLAAQGELVAKITAHEKKLLAAQSETAEARSEAKREKDLNQKNEVKLGDQKLQADQLKAEIAELKAEIAELKAEIAELKATKDKESSARAGADKEEKDPKTLHLEGRNASLKKAAESISKENARLKKLIRNLEHWNSQIPSLHHQIALINNQLREKNEELDREKAKSTHYMQALADRAIADVQYKDPHQTIVAGGHAGGYYDGGHAGGYNGYGFEHAYVMQQGMQPVHFPVQAGYYVAQPVVNQGGFAADYYPQPATLAAAGHSQVVEIQAPAPQSQDPKPATASPPAQVEPKSAKAADEGSKEKGGKGAE